MEITVILKHALLIQEISHSNQAVLTDTQPQENPLHPVSILPNLVLILFYRTGNEHTPPFAQGMTEETSFKANTVMTRSQEFIQKSVRRGRKPWKITKLTFTNDLCHFGHVFRRLFHVFSHFQDHVDQLHHICLLGCHAETYANVAV